MYEGIDPNALYIPLKEVLQLCGYPTANARFYAKKLNIDLIQVAGRLVVYRAELDKILAKAVALHAQEAELTAARTRVAKEYQERMIREAEARAAARTPEVV